MPKAKKGSGAGVKKGKPVPTGKRAAPRAKTAGRKAAPRNASRKTRRFHEADIHLFSPLSEGERADALRTLIEDKRLANMAKVGRYRVIAVEPLVVKPPHTLTGHRLARIAIYDYSADRAVDASVDLDAGGVAHLQITKAQPMLAREEEAAAVAIALADERIKNELSLGDEPQVAMHYWSRRDTDLAYRRRSAAVLFGQSGSRPSFIAVVDLLDNQVTELVPSDQW
jgi:hypothetical protein